MLFIDPLLLGALAQLAATPACIAPEPTQINVIPKTRNIKYDFSQSLANIQDVKSSTPDPYGIHSASITQGFMAGQINLTHNIKFDHKVVGRGDQACIWYKSIDIEIEITPKITIAKEIRGDQCMYKAVLEHEKKHIHVDREAVNKTAKNIGQKIYDRLKQTGFAQGPVTQAQAKQVSTAMYNQVTSVITEEYQWLDQERRTKQAGVDTREEYERVKALCPDFHKRKQRLYEKAVEAKKSQ